MYVCKMVGLDFKRRESQLYVEKGYRRIAKMMATMFNLSL